MVVSNSRWPAALCAFLLAVLLPCRAIINLRSSPRLNIAPSSDSVSPGDTRTPCERLTDLDTHRHTEPCAEDMKHNYIDDRRIGNAPLKTSTVGEDIPLKFERPVQNDMAEQTIKQSEKDMLRLRRTRIEIKKIEEEQKRKRKQEQAMKEVVKKQKDRKNRLRDVVPKKINYRKVPTKQNNITKTITFRLKKFPKMRWRAPIVPNEGWLIMNAGEPICGVTDLICDSKILRTSCEIDKDELVVGQMVDVGGSMAEITDPRDRRTLTMKFPLDCGSQDVESVLNNDNGVPVQYFAEHFGARSKNHTLIPMLDHDERFLMHQTLDPTKMYSGIKAFRFEDYGKDQIRLCGVINLPSEYTHIIPWINNNECSNDDLLYNSSHEEIQGKNATEAVSKALNVADSNTEPNATNEDDDVANITRHRDPEEDEEGDDDRNDDFRRRRRRLLESASQVMGDRQVEITSKSDLVPRTNETLVINTTFTSTPVSCKVVSRKSVIVRFQSRAPFSRNSTIVFRNELNSKEKELIEDTFILNNGSKYIRSNEDHRLDFFPGDLFSTVDGDFKSTVVNTTNDYIQVRDEYVISKSAASLSLVSKIGAYRHWAMPGTIIGEGIIYDVTDDSERDTCVGGTMVVAIESPRSTTAHLFCKKLMNDKAHIENGLVIPRGINSHTNLVRMSGVFSTTILNANFTKKKGREALFSEDDRVKTSEMYLHRKYCGDPIQAIKLYRVHVEHPVTEHDNPLPTNVGTLLPGTFCAGNGSNILVSTVDLRSQLLDGDNLFIGDLLCIVESVASARVEIKCPTVIGGYYLSPYTGCNLQGWRKKGELVNDLSRSILQCTDMDCIHRIQSLQCAHYAENGHPSRTKKDLPNFCLEKESLRLFIIYTDGRKKEYRYSLKKDKVAKVFDTVVKLEQVDSTRDVKLRNLRTNGLLDTKDMDRAFGEVQGILNDDTLLVIKSPKRDRWGFFTRL